MKKLLLAILGVTILIVLVDLFTEQSNSQKQSNTQAALSPNKTEDKSEKKPSIKGTASTSNSEIKSSAKYTTPEEYAKTLILPEAGIYNATVTDIGMLVIAVDAQPNVNFDYFAKSYLDGALKEGVSVKGCLIVDVKDCHFMKGAVTGKRIGKAYR